MTMKLNYLVCHICDSKMCYEGIDVFKCPNKCCEYDIDVEAPADVDIILFGSDDLHFRVKLYDENFTHHYKDYDKNLEENLKEYLKVIEYWRENDRYLVELMK